MFKAVGLDQGPFDSSWFFQTISRLIRGHIPLLFVLFAFFCFYLTEHYSLSKERATLEQRKEQLTREIHEVRRRTAEIEEKLASESDLKWQELTLIRQMGVVPADQKKILFVSER